MIRHLLLVVCIATASVLLMRLSYRSDPLPGFPRLMLWAWESPQDLSFIKSRDVGIAFLARTVWLDTKGARSRPRLQPLRFTPGTALMAVVRLESKGQELPSTADAVREVMPVTQIAGVRALQIDFDARQSEKEWYAAFLREIRRVIPDTLPLTITALESWCEYDGWIGNLPVADATPMLFRMGPEDRPSPTSFSAGVCRSSVGVSTDELPPKVPQARRLYFFHPGPWTQDAYNTAVAQARRWWK